MRKIFVKAKPLAYEEKVEQIDENHFTVWVKEPPAKGLANKAIAKAIAEYFHTSISSVKIVSGFSSRQKILLVD